MGELAVLLGVPLRRARNTLRSPEHVRWTRSLFLLSVGVIVLSFVFGLFRLVFAYFYRQPLIGPLLVNRMFGMAYLSFFLMLVYSNVMSSLSSHFLSRDLPLLMTSPARALSVFVAKAWEAVVGSSWMVILMCVPLLAAFGTVKHPPLAFYLLAPAALVPFLLAPAAFSMGLNVGLMYLFPARRMREVMLLVATVMFAGVAVAVVLLEPEKMVNPAEGMMAVEFLRQLSIPAVPYLPSAWLANATITSSNLPEGWGVYLRNIGLLVLAAALMWTASLLIAGRYYRGAWQQASESFGVRRGVRLASFLLPGRAGAYGAILRKDFKLFVREPAQWGQVLLLSTLVLMYVLFVAKVPDDLARGLRSLLFFLNLGFIGLILTAVAARFLFPQVSLEGESFVALKSAPISMTRYLIVRWAVGTAPLMILGALLIAFTVPLLKVDAYMAGIAYVSMAAMTLGISALAAGCGACFAKFKVTNPEEIVTSLGGFFFMSLALAFVMLMLVIEAQPVRMHYSMAFLGHYAGPEWLTPAALGLVGAMTLVCVWFSLRAGANALRERDF